MLLTFNVLDLPSARHRAGLAGLVIYLDVCAEHRMKGFPKIVKRDSFEVTIEFTEKNFLTFMTHFRKGIELVKNKQGGKGIFPALEILKKIGMPKLWIDYWRMILYKARTTGTQTYNELWKEKPATYKTALEKKFQSFFEKEKKSKKPLDLSKYRDYDFGDDASSLLGSPAANSEKIKIYGFWDQTFLTQFAFLASFPFLPLKYVWDHKKEDFVPKRDGFVIAFPDVINLDIVDEIREVIRTPEPDPNGKIRTWNGDGEFVFPRGAEISLLPQAGMDFLSRIAQARVRKGEVHDMEDYIMGVEVLHFRDGSETIQSRYVEDYAEFLGEYDKTRTDYRDSVFFEFLFNNLINHRVWYKNITDLFLSNSYKSVETSLGENIKRKVRNTMKNLEVKREWTDEDKLLNLVNSVIRGRLNKVFERRMQTKCDYKNPEHRLKMCGFVNELVLFLRSRDGKYFKEAFFTLGSEGIFMPPENRILLLRRFTEQDGWRDIKDMCMMCCWGAYSTVKKEEESGNE